jgi:ABC-2 type transport system permease protein
MRAALDIALKDLRQKVRDRSALLLSIVAPFALAALFASVLGGVDEDFHASWALVDLDGGQLAEALDAGALRAVESEGLISLERLSTRDAARRAIEAGEVATAIVIPVGFTADQQSGRGSTLELIVDPDATISGQVARSVLTGFASRADAVQLSIRTVLASSGSTPDAGLIGAVAADAQAMADPITIVTAAAADREAGYSTYYAAAMAIMFVFLAAQFGLASIHAERRTGTLPRMLAAPLAWWSILIGKTIVSVALAVVSMTVIVVGTALLLGAAWGDPLAVAALVLAAAIAATGIALLAVAFTRTEEQASSAVAIVTLTLAIIGGSFFPVSQGPEALAQLSRVTPHAWFLRGVSDVSTGGDLFAAAGPVLVLLAIGLLSGGLALPRARRLVIG